MRRLILSLTGRIRRALRSRPSDRSDNGLRYEYDTEQDGLWVFSYDKGYQFLANVNGINAILVYNRFRSHNISFLVIQDWLLAPSDTILNR